MSWLAPGDRVQVTDQNDRQWFRSRGTVLKADYTWILVEMYSGDRVWLNSSKLETVKS